MFGPDAKSSLTLDEVKQLVDDCNAIYLAKENPINKNDTSAFVALKSVFEKSLAINKELPKGHILAFDDLEAKKPKGFGIDAALFQNCIGKILKQSKLQRDFLNEEDFE